LGASKNAVMSQFWVAMILYLLIAYIKFRSKVKESMLDLTRIIRTTLFQKINFIDILGLSFEEVGKIPKDGPGCYQLKFEL
jgi:putative transposase